MTNSPNGLVKCEMRLSAGDVHFAGLPGQHPAFVLGGAAPDPELLARLQREVETLRLHRAGTADRLCPFDVGHGRAGGAEREEQLGIAVLARGACLPFWFCPSGEAPHGPSPHAQALCSSALLRYPITDGEARQGVVDAASTSCDASRCLRHAHAADS